MVKVFNPEFDVDVTVKSKDKSKSKGTVISRKCLAVVAIIDDEFKALVNLNKKDIDYTNSNSKTKFVLKDEQLVLPFTEKSLSLYDKTIVWCKNKDEYGHHICYIRDSRTAHVAPGISKQYDAFKENLLISGYIIRVNGKMYFEYEDIISYNYLSNSYIKDVNIDNDKPLFK